MNLQLLKHAAKYLDSQRHKIHLMTREIFRINCQSSVQITFSSDFRTSSFIPTKNVFVFKIKHQNVSSLRGIKSFIFVVVFKESIFGPDLLMSHFHLFFPRCVSVWHFFTFVVTAILIFRPCLEWESFKSGFFHFLVI